MGGRVNCRRRSQTRHPLRRQAPSVRPAMQPIAGLDAAARDPAALAPAGSAVSVESTADIEARVYEAIAAALLQGRLRPGAQLVERDLAAAFGCTRGALRKVLARLGFEGKLVLQANRGAFVPSPSEQDVRDVYRARQIVEAGIVTALCGKLSVQHKRRLSAHIGSENRASRAGRIEDSVRLAGQFHVLLTELAGSTVLEGFVSQLIAKTELYKALFDPSKGSACSADQHALLVDALERGDLPAALEALQAHLAELEERVVRQLRASAREDLGAVFGL
jgi:DNA-binding GntR family transcriptional regulator